METTIRIDQANKKDAIALHHFATKLLKEHGVETAGVDNKVRKTTKQTEDEGTFGDSEVEDTAGVEFDSGEAEQEDISNEDITNAFKKQIKKTGDKTAALKLLKKYGAKTPADIPQAKRAAAIEALND